MCLLRNLAMASYKLVLQTYLVNRCKKIIKFLIHLYIHTIKL
jgi:hypothetical protein